MPIVELTSNLSQIKKPKPTPEKTTVNTGRVDFFSNDRAEGFTQRKTSKNTDFILEGFPKTNFIDQRGNKTIEFNDKNTFETNVNKNQSRLLNLHEKDNFLEKLYARGKSTTDSLGLRKGKFGNTQPYVIRDVGQRWNLSNSPVVGNTVELIRGGASTYASRTAADIGRTTDFLTKSGQGIAFLAKQQFLQTLNPGGDLGVRANIYNPLSLQLNAQNFIKFDRHIDIRPASQLLRIGVSKFAPRLGFTYSDTDSARGLFPFNIASNRRLDAIKEYSRFGQGERQVKSSEGKDRINLIPYGNRSEATYAGIETENTLDFIPFRFRDVVNNKYIVFRAILSGITDTFSPEYQPERYIGRPDSVYVYQGTNREISFTFDVYPKSREELEPLWTKMNYLSGLTYPTFGNVQGGGQSMIAPFCELTIGDMYKDTPGYINNLTYTVQDQTTWETETDYKLPKYIQAAVTFTYIGKRLPSSTSRHFEVDWIGEELSEQEVDLIELTEPVPPGGYA